jgi:hypothetical protein
MRDDAKLAGDEIGRIGKASSSSSAPPAIYCRRCMAGNQLCDPCFEDERSLFRDKVSLIRAQNSLLILRRDLT